jgi:hypothetical protein
MPKPRSLKCPNCLTELLVAICEKCGREFVLTAGHAHGAPREFYDQALKLPLSGMIPGLCDFCSTPKEDNPVAAGLHQKICPNCMTSAID